MIIKYQIESDKLMFNNKTFINIKSSDIELFDIHWRKYNHRIINKFRKNSGRSFIFVKTIENHISFNKENYFGVPKKLPIEEFELWLKLKFT